MQKGKFLSNAIMLTLTTFLLRLVFTAFRVVVSNKVGAECMGLYQLTFAIYGISLNVACSGINFAVIRLVSHAQAQGKYSIKHIMRKSFVYSAFFGIFAFLLVYFFADKIALYWLFDKRSALSIKIFAVSLPFISLSSAVTGFFYALGRVKITLFSRILEQILEIVFFFIFIGLVPQGNIELSCATIVLSSSLSEIVGAVFLAVCCAFFKENKKPKENGIFKKICSTAFSAAVGTYLKSGLQTLENTLVPIGFRKYGASQSEALSGYGVLCSMVMPTIFFPSFVLSAFSMLLIPEFTRAQSLNRQKEIQKNTAFTVRLTLYFALFVSVNFICFGKPLGDALYNTDKAGELIKIMAPLVPFMYLDSIADALLKGLGEYNRVIIYSTIDTVVSILLILMTVWRFGLYGYILVVFVSTMLNSCMSTARLLKITNNRLSFGKDIVSVLIVAFASALFSKCLVEMLKIDGIIKLLFLFAISGITFALLLKKLCKSAWQVILTAISVFACMFGKSNLLSLKNINNTCVNIQKGGEKNAS